MSAVRKPIPKLRELDFSESEFKPHPDFLTKILGVSEQDVHLYIEPIDEELRPRMIDIRLGSDFSGYDPVDYADRLSTKLKCDVDYDIFGGSLGQLNPDSLMALYSVEEIKDGIEKYNEARRTGDKMSNFYHNDLLYVFYKITRPTKVRARIEVEFDVKPGHDDGSVDGLDEVITRWLRVQMEMDGNLIQTIIDDIAPGAVSFKFNPPTFHSRMLTEKEFDRDCEQRND